SMDAITNRGEPEADLGFAITQFMNHLSILAQTLILLATPEFGMVKLADKFSTGSSIMPQKKNPDPLEVVKSKTSVAQGVLVSLMGIGKASFIGYNRDTQWTKYLIMDLVDECLPAALVMKGIVETLDVNKEVMEKWCHKGFIGATSLMEQMIQTYKLPMRQVKVVVEKAVKHSQGEDKVNYAALEKSLKEVGLEIKITRAQVRSWQDPVYIISQTNSFGSPGKQALIASSQILKNKLQLIQKKLHGCENQMNEAKKLLLQETANVLKGGG
ncbi:MAG: argininosuccinate lyase, partial [Candidatus Nomurabacteria bacterium GW2011_GWB1_37_5]